MIKTSISKLFPTFTSLTNSSQWQEIDSIRKELEEAQLEVQRLNESLELLRMERDSVNAENHRLMNAVSDAASASGSQGSGDGECDCDSHISYHFSFLQAFRPSLLPLFLQFPPSYPSHPFHFHHFPSCLILPRYLILTRLFDSSY